MVTMYYNHIKQNKDHDWLEISCFGHIGGGIPGDGELQENDVVVSLYANIRSRSG